jgi:hypothetical protein
MIFYKENRKILLLIIIMCIIIFSSLIYVHYNPKYIEQFNILESDEFNKLVTYMQSINDLSDIAFKINNNQDFELNNLTINGTLEVTDDTIIRNLNVDEQGNITSIKSLNNIILNNKNINSNYLHDFLNIQSGNITDINIPKPIITKNPNNVRIAEIKFTKKFIQKPKIILTLNYVDINNNIELSKMIDSTTTDKFMIKIPSTKFSINWIAIPSISNINIKSTSLNVISNANITNIQFDKYNSPANFQYNSIIFIKYINNSNKEVISDMFNIINSTNDDPIFSITFDKNYKGNIIMYRINFDKYASYQKFINGINGLSSIFNIDNYLMQYNNYYYESIDIDNTTKKIQFSNTSCKLSDIKYIN